jgi:hypothetical protein
MNYPETRLGGPHFGHGGFMIALDEACVADDDMVLSFFRREHAQLSATDAPGNNLAGDTLELCTKLRECKWFIYPVALQNGSR